MTNNLNILLNQYCPNGVPWVKLGEVCTILDNLRKPVSKSNRCKGQYPYYGANGIQDYVETYIFEGSFLLIGEDGSVITHKGTPVINWASGKFWVNNHAHILSNIEGVTNLRYLFYILGVTDISDMVHGVPPKLNQQNLRDISIPLPPLPVQEEIVRILDSMTALIENIDEEIENRCKQYISVREDLLELRSYDTKSFGGSCQLKARIGWQGLTKKEYHASGEYYLITGTDFTPSHTINFQNCVYVDKDRYDQDENIQIREQDVLITKDGTLGKIAYIDNLPKPATLNGGVFVVRNLTGEMLQKYIMYYLTSNNFTQFIDMNHTNGSIMHLTQALLTNFSIPVPPLAVQQQIVDQLDTFESLINNLKTERNLRQKQYEYYREKLLTFK